MSSIIPVALGARSYDIHVGSGLLSEAGTLLKPFAKTGRVVVVTDGNIQRLYSEKLGLNLIGAGLKPAVIYLPYGEQTKNFAALKGLIDVFLNMEIDRNDLVVALGGGVIGDLTGFAAGIYKRGVDIAHIPTTLLAQVDSSIGGKTGINMAEGKNLVGVFHQPRIVIADTAVLATLPRRELLGGYAEIAKCALMGDADFFSWLEAHAAQALNGDEAALTKAVARSCEMKAAIVALDEREANGRALLNLGHTFGHALEAATGYSERLTHGEAVAIGCVLAFQLSAQLGLCPKGESARVREHFSGIGLPTRITQIPGPPPTTDALMRHMGHDKKATGGRLAFILARGVGQAFIARDVPTEAVISLLDDETR